MPVIISIVTPSFNQGRFIEETIVSVLSQEGDFHLDYLIMDGGSADQTLQIVRTYEELINNNAWPIQCRGISFRWWSEPDSGQSHAINKGFRLAAGEILAWLNSDDTLQPGALAAVAACMSARPELQMVYGDGNILDEGGKLLHPFPYTQPFDLWALTFKLDYILQPSAFFRKAALEKIGYLNEKLHWCMDWDLWIRLGRRYRIGYIPVVLSNARTYADTKTATGGYRRFCEIVSLLHSYSNRLLIPAYILYCGGSITSFIFLRSFRVHQLIKRILSPVRRMLWTFASNSQGVYPDGWLGRSAHFLFGYELDTDRIQFTLELPDDGRVVPNEAVLTINGQRGGVYRFMEPGCHEIQIPYSRGQCEPLAVSLKFKRHLPPDVSFRYLSCRLTSVIY